ncbi:hypothetical protein SLE2022_078510 [Rubroshorea leprosula]
MMALGKPLLTWMMLTPRGKGFLMGGLRGSELNSPNLCHSSTDLKSHACFFHKVIKSVFHKVNSTNKRARVDELGEWIRGTWTWRWNLRKELFV